MRPPGKTSAPPAKAMPWARSTISSSGGPAGWSRTSTKVAAGNGSDTPVAGIALVKKLRRYSTVDLLTEPGADVSVAR